MSNICSYDEAYTKAEAYDIGWCYKCYNKKCSKEQMMNRKNNSTFIIGENKIDKTFTPEEIWNALCKVIRGASGEAVDGIIILCEEILDVPAPQIEKKLFSDGVIDDLYYRNYDECDI